MKSPKTPSGREAMKSLDIRQFFHRCQNQLNKRELSTDQPIERELKRLKTDPNEDGESSMPSAPVAEFVGDSTTFVTPNKKHDGALKGTPDPLVNSSDSTLHDQETIVKSDLDQTVEKPTESESLVKTEDISEMETSLTFEVHNKEFSKTLVIPLQRLESTKFFTAKIKKSLEKLKRKAKNYYKEEFEVETILDYKWDRKAGEGLYKIKWTGYEELTWEPIENIISCQEVIEEFYLRRTSQRESARPSEKRKMEVPPDPKTLFEKKKNFLAEICPPPDQTRLQEFFNQYRAKKMETWSDAKFKGIIEEYRGKELPAKIRDQIHQQIMIRHLLAKRKDQLSRLKEWETEINKTSSEPAPLRIENDVDFEGPPRHMTYIGENIIGNGVVFNDDPPMWCECEDDCQEKKGRNCCPGNHNQFHAYSKSRKLRVPLGTPIFECNRKCKCGPTCSNRVVQRGRRIKLCIFRTSNGCGWGVKTLEKIKKGSFVVEYVGEVILSEEAERRGKTYDANGITYLFDVDFHDSENLYTIDAALYGNVAHFINHSCNPNLAIFSVWVNNLDPNLPKLCFYSMRDIEKGEQLTFDYSQKIENGEAQIEDEAKGLTNCKCDAPNCRKVLFLI